MKTLELKKDFYWTGVLDKDLKVFDIIMETRFGTSYNSYILKSQNETILFETAKVDFFDAYVEALSSICEIKSISHIIVNHTEMDHAGSIEGLLQQNPEIKIVGSYSAILFLRDIVHCPFKEVIVNDNDTLTIGSKTLRFIMAPNLHWPDTMYTYIEEEQILVTCDSFGAHYAHEAILRSKVEAESDYEQALKYYFDHIMGPFKSYVIKALDKIQSLDISLIATGHGPVLDCKIEDVIEKYRQWSQIETSFQKKVVIPYVSAYGYTQMLAHQISDGIKASGEIEVKLYDLEKSSQEEVLKEMAKADGLLIGSPTILQEALKPVWQLFASMNPVVDGGKLASAFGSYGWSGEAVSHLLERLKQLHMQVVEGYRCKLKPSVDELKQAYTYGYEFGCQLLKKELPHKKRKVKCLICGEILDEGVEICPICGVGKEHFVLIEENETAFKQDSQEKFLIIGNGAAGLNAAMAIRMRNKTCSIILAGDEAYPSYNRVMLTKEYFDEMNSEKLYLKEAEWYIENNIQTLLKMHAQEIDVANKQVIFANYDKITYDKLLLCYGAECFLPPVKGINQQHVIAIRRIEDILKLKQQLTECKTAVVIGGGVLGIEAAFKLSQAHLAVTILESASQLMIRQLDEKASLILQSKITQQKIKVLTGASIVQISEKAVFLNDGQIIKADLVIVSAGVKVDLQLAQSAGIQCGRAIIVNEYLETSISDIYAAGDCAQYQNINYANWQQAVEMGKTAGANAAGDSIQYENKSLGLTINEKMLSLFTIGDNGKLNHAYESVEIEDVRRYEKYYFIHEHLCGATLIGDLSKVSQVSEAIEKKTLLKEFY